MTTAPRRQAVLAPAAAVLCAATLSWLGYELSPRAGNALAHEIVARIAGTVYFAAVAFGPFYVCLVASLREVPAGRRIAAALLTPLLWMTKECVLLTRSHPAIECLYYFVNPLHVVLLLTIAIELALATLVARAIRWHRGEIRQVRAAWPIAAIVAALIPVVVAWTAGRGENSYAAYLAGYRALFAPVSVSDMQRQEQSPPAPGPATARGAAGVTGAAGDPPASATSTPARGSKGGGTRDIGKAAAAADAGRPNLIFILGDNHNAGTMGCAGHPVIHTPAMDRLAREGVRFRNAFNTTSLCSPSRASILTGAYAHTHGVLNNHTSWTGKLPTFLERLSAAGYATAFIGKWHMPGEGLPSLPFLDLFVSYTYREGQGSYFDCPMIVNGREVPSRKRYITEETTDYAIEFIEHNVALPQAERRPFMIYLSHRPGHPPYQAPEGIRGMYDGADVAAVLPPGIDSWWFGKTHGGVFQGAAMGSYFDQYRGYLETLTAMDAGIGRLLARIDELGMGGNTAVIYMADNGMQWGTHGVHGIREPYDDCAKVPLIVRAPWLVPDPGALRDQLVLNIDIAPTLVELAGAAPLERAEGESLLPILRDAGAPGRESFLMEYWRYFPENTPTYRAVRTRTLEYVEFERGRTPWLFDLATDPGQTQNLYATPRGDLVLPQLRRTLDQLASGRRP